LRRWVSEWNNFSRRALRVTSAIACCINLAITALLFCPPNTRSNSALISSGTLKFTVAIAHFLVVEDFNNESIQQSLGHYKLMIIKKLLPTTARTARIGSCARPFPE
jgi:hypothetical protein